MAADDSIDYYEVLQISPNAEQDTVQRVYRLLAQRFHPDNQETGDTERFRELTEAYHVLNDPEQRAQYDILHHQVRQDRIRLVNDGIKAKSDFEVERLVRLAVLEALYSKRRLHPNDPGIFDRDLEDLTGSSREHLEFTFWYLLQRNLVRRGEQSRLVITAEGVDYLEQHFESAKQRKRLREGRDPE